MVNLRTRQSGRSVKSGGGNTVSQAQIAPQRTSTRTQNKKAKYTDDDDETDLNEFEGDKDLDLEIESSTESGNEDNNDNAKNAIEEEVEYGEEDMDIKISSDSDSEEEKEEENDISDDDKEIRRIILKTNAEKQILHMTARQKAKSAEHTDDPGNTFLELPLINSKPLTEEQVLNKSEKSRRRKMQRDAKIEETKRATIDRLLMKQQKTTPVDNSNDDKLTIISTQDKMSESKEIQPGFYRYIDSKIETVLQFPTQDALNLAFPTTTGLSSKLNDNKILYCEVCKHNLGKYTHPKNLKRFCSLKCYNLI